jgi:hypothetical protein
LTLTERPDPMREGLSGNYLKVRLDGTIPGNELVEGEIIGEADGYLVMDQVRLRGIDRSPGPRLPQHTPLHE